MFQAVPFIVLLFASVITLRAYIWPLKLLADFKENQQKDSFFDTVFLFP